MTENKLKPCPFCGGKMTIIGADKRKQDVVQLYHPICTECDCMLSYYDTLEEAIEACNRRANDGTALFGKKKNERFTVRYDTYLFDCEFTDCGFYSYGAYENPYLDCDAFILQDLLVGRAVMVDE